MIARVKSQCVFRSAHNLLLVAAGFDREQYPFPGWVVSAFS